MRLRLCAPSRAECELGSLRSNSRAPGNQLLDALGTLFDQNLRGFRIAQAVAGLQRVLQVEADFVFVAERQRRYRPAHTACRIRLTSRFASTSTRPAAASSMAARRPGNPGANHQEIGLGWNAPFINGKWYHFRGTCDQATRSIRYDGIPWRR